ncbi:MAG: hypothetical protein WC346_07915 [Methanogenium sp.]
MSAFESLNTTTSPNLLKKGELVYAENVRQEKVGLLATRDGSTVVGNNISATEEYGLFAFQAFSGKGLYRVCTVAATTSIYWLNSATWTSLSGAGLGTGITAGEFKGCIADGNLYLVNYNDENRMISGSDGTTVTDSTTVSGSFYNAPKASLIAYYNDQLYLGDFLVGSVRNSTKVIHSSKSMGLVCLVNGDPASPYTTMSLTDTSYIYAVSGADTYDIYRGGSKVAVFTVTSLTEDTVTGTIVFESGFTTVQSSDEVWVANTYSGSKIFRWPKNSSSTGSIEKEHGTFTLQSTDGSPLTILDTIGNKLLISNKTSMALFDGTTLDHFNTNIGCVSRNGYVKAFGAIFFISYDGIYATDGSSSPKLMSKKISNYFIGATKTGLEACAAGKKGNSIFFYLGSVTLYNEDGSTKSTIAKCTVEYDVSSNLFYIHSGVSMKYLLSGFANSSGTDRLLIATDDTSTLVLDYLLGTTDNGTAIPIRFDFLLPPFSGKFDILSQPNEISVELLRGVGLKAFFSLDGDSFYPADHDADKGSTIIRIPGKGDDFDTPPTCRRLGVSFRKNNSQKTVIAGFAVSYAKIEREQQLDK